jgi:hypothetical protein
MPTKLTQRQRDKLVEAAQTAITFDVEGKGDFPTDMLRYDHCWPATQTDAGLMGITTFASTRQVRMRGLTGPTPARWASFGWKCVPVTQ